MPQRLEIERRTPWRPGFERRVPQRRGFKRRIPSLHNSNVDCHGAEGLTVEDPSIHILNVEYPGVGDLNVEYPMVSHGFPWPHVVSRGPVCFPVVPRGPRSPAHQVWGFGFAEIRACNPKDIRGHCGQPPKKKARKDSRKLPDCMDMIEQRVAKQYFPPKCRLWKSRADSTWHIRMPDWPEEKSRSIRQRGETRALKLLCTEAWYEWSVLEGRDISEAPIDGLLDCAELSLER